MPAEPLTSDEREEIRAGIVGGEADGQIAARLGRHRTTINREISRNGGRPAYGAVVAEARAGRCRARPKVPLLAADDGELGWVVMKRLMAGDSPMTISIELARGTHGVTAKVSHETIYQAAYGRDRGLHARAWRLLPRRRRSRKHRGQRATQARSSPLGSFAKISERPPIAARRSEVGHLEGDLIIGARNASAIATIFDRASRYVWLGCFTGGGYDADRCAQVVTDILGEIPNELRRTLTWDRGTEMADHPGIAAATGIDVYFCDPHSPWQRPTNENGNRLLRRWLPKGPDLSLHTPADLARIAHRINTIPRRSLDWDTAHNRYHAAVAMTG